MRPATALICSFLLIISFANAQVRIEGKFNSSAQLFETKDREYSVGFFKDGIAFVVKDGYVGLIDSTGTIITEPVYDKIFEFNEGIALITRDGKYGFINREGKVIMAPFANKLRPFRNGVSVYTVEHRNHGIVKANGEFLTGAKYEYISEDNDGYFSFIRENSAGILKPNGKEIILLKDYKFNGPPYFIQRTDSRLELVTKYRNCILYKFHEGLANYFEQKGDKALAGCIDEDGKKVIPAKFEFIEPFRQGLAPAIQNGKWGLINRKGETMVPFIYNSVSPDLTLYPDGFQKFGRSGYYGRNNFQEAEYYLTNRYFATKDTLCGLIDTLGNILVPFKYNSIQHSENDRYIVSAGNKWGVVDAAGKIILPVKYNRLTYLFEGLYCTSSSPGLFGASSFYGVINEKGDVILPYEYNSVIAADDDHGIASKHTGGYSLNTGIPRYIYIGEYFYFDKEGKSDGKKHTFTKKIEGISDNYHESTALSMGPHFFSPHASGFDTGFPKETIIKGAEDDSIHYFSARPLKNGFSVVGRKIKKEGLLTLMNPQEHYQKGVMNASKEILIPLSYDDITEAEDFPLFIVRKGDKSGVIDINNKVVIPIEYDYIRSLGTAFTLTKKRWSKMWDGQDTYHWTSAVYGFDGKEMIPFDPAVDDFQQYYDGQWGKGTSSRHELINKKGEKIK